MSQKPLVICAFGWGCTLKLYQEYLDVNGTIYALNDLMHVRAIYRRIMHISSLRLELQFHEHLLLLRGINANEAAERLLIHLKRYCPAATISSLPAIQRQKSSPEMPIAKEHSTMTGITGITAMSETPTLEHEPIPHIAFTNATPAAPIVSETPRWLLELTQDMQRMQSRKMRRARSLSGIPETYGTRGRLAPHAFDALESTQGIRNSDMSNAQPKDSLHTVHESERMNLIDDVDVERERFAQHLQADTLPSLTLPIPLRLAPGEQARYNIQATLCAELLSDGGNTPTYTYPAKDQGTLILTNRRLIYMGRRGQRVLSYTRIIRISRMHGAIAILTDMTAPGYEQEASALSTASHRVHREVFQVSRPLECALYLDHLLRQFYTQVATRHLSPASAVPAMNTREGNGITEGINARSIQQSLNSVAITNVDIADAETCPLVAINM